MATSTDDPNLNLVAFCGLVELLHWEQTSSQGSRIKLSLWNGRDDLAHFDAATKRSKRRAGQRYAAIWQDPLGNPAPGMPSELWFGGGSWNHRQGATVLFTVHPDDLEIIKAFRTADDGGEGTRWYLALVELDEDDQPIDQAQRDMLEALVPEQPKGGPVSKNAGMLCGQADFWRFLQGRFQQAVDSEEAAAALVRAHCGIDSRAWLDHDPEARARYEQLKHEFLQWGRRHARTGT